MRYKLPDREAVVTRAQLENNAKNWPDEIFVVFEDGTSWSYKESLEVAYRSANALRQAGVKQGDRVAVFLENGPGYMRAWWGAAVLGAALCPIHTAAKGTLLSHLLRTIAATTLIAETPGLEALAKGDASALLPPIVLTPADVDSQDASAPALDRPIESWDPAIYVTTSGTTGLSKVVPNTYLHTYLGGSHTQLEAGRGRGDTFLINLPLYHGAAFWMASGCLASGAHMFVQAAPNFRAYWETARDSGATMAVLLGAMVPFLLAAPERPAEHEHKISFMLAAPIPANVAEFQRRFGVGEVYTAWGMSEVPGATHKYNGDPLVHGYMGRVRDGYQVRIVDENDLEVEPGKAGEIVVRSEQPWMIATEYLGNADATVAAWRNGWFHTGDMGYKNGDMFFFTDRIKDSLRRRGENISAVEVETAIVQHPAVASCAVVAVRDQESAEDEVKAWLVLEPGATLEFSDILEYLADRIPYFMVPRFFETTDALPLTASQKVKKFELRERGNTEATWDREAHGYRVTRKGLELSGIPVAE